MDELDNSARDWLGKEGPFAKRDSAFEIREQQLEMAEAVESAIKKNSTAVVESGTGTGKTFAYLVPALLSGKKVLISTGTKHLQEQLFFRDIPKVVDHLMYSPHVSLLKGRANYLCIDRYHQYRQSSEPQSIKNKKELADISDWRSKTVDGDIAELTELSEASDIWPKVTSTADNCLGQGCDFFKECFVNRARKQALEADVVVINHHLFFADKSLKEGGFGALLPDSDVTIFDEAHQIPDIASNFLGHSFSSWQIKELADDVKLAEASDKSQVKALIEKADAAQKAAVDVRLSFGLNERRIAFDELQREIPHLLDKLGDLRDCLFDLSEILEDAAVAGESLQRCWERAQELKQACQYVIDSAQKHDDEGLKASREICWFDIAKRSFRIHHTPIRVGDEIAKFLYQEDKSYVFTSATLSVNTEFDHYGEAMSLPHKTVYHSWPSPFDYFEQSVMLVPEAMPEPRDRDYVQELFKRVLPLVKASKGRAFILFTSFRSMYEFADLIEDEGFNLLVQGEQTKRILIEQFSSEDNSVLLATMGFWEGVDVKGSDLALVVIDKLPFESPTDPVLKARLKELEKAGINPFMDYQVPRAVISLRQGAGRLIRGTQDKGVLMIGDPRLRTTHYGRLFLDSLPRMRRTTDEAKVRKYLETC